MVVVVGGMAYHQNRIFISFWMEKHFFFISRDTCKTAFFLPTVCFLILTSNQGQKGDRAALKNLFLSEAKCMCDGGWGTVGGGRET